MTHALAVGLAVVAALLALSCEGGETPPATAPAATATPEATASAIATPTAAPATTPTPTPTATATPAVATPTATATFARTPTLPPTLIESAPTGTVTGPLIVFYEVTEWIDTPRAHLDEEGAVEARSRDHTRRVYVYDIGADQYWAAFEYAHTGLIERRQPGNDYFLRTYDEMSAVQVAGQSLVVWSLGQVRRVNLGGRTERILFEHDQISWIEVSPDGTKVAIMYGVATRFYGTSAVVVLDVATGEELLHTGRRFDPIFIDRARSFRYPDRWNADGTALLVEEEDERGLLRLDGEFRVLPPDWHLSPDLRYAVRGGAELGQHSGVRFWRSFDVLDVEDGAVLWSVQAATGGAVTWDYGGYGGYGRAWWPHSRFEVNTSDTPYLMTFRELDPGADDSGEWYVRATLDVETGEIEPFTGDVEELLAPRAWTDCGRYKLAAPIECRIAYDGRTIWVGAQGQIETIGLIYPVADLTVRGPARMDAVVVPDPPPPPPRDEMRGPILLYEIHKDHPTRPRLAIAYDQGTGRSWTLHRRENRESCRAHQVAYEGFIACNGTPERYPGASELLYVGVDGRTVTLLPYAPHVSFRVAPDGTMVATSSLDDLYVLSLPSGAALLTMVSEDIYGAFGDDVLEQSPDSARFRGWRTDGAVLFVTVSLEGYRNVVDASLTLDGEVTPMPPGVLGTGANLSADMRYLARGTDEALSEDGRWSHIYILDFPTGRLLWSIDPAEPLSDSYWEWASPTTFAWSSGRREPYSSVNHGATLFDFDSQAPSLGERAEVSIIDVTTGEIEVMDSADYLARFYPPGRATVDCPANSGHPCRILLDGKVVGEGRWPTIIGIVELDTGSR